MHAPDDVGRVSAHNCGCRAEDDSKELAVVTYEALNVSGGSGWGLQDERQEARGLLHICIYTVC